ncbi:MAG: hypothetical protein WD673_00025 [Alphaproteobacteria bacterium]
MSSIVAAVLGYAVLLAFVGGLAVAIGAVPFFVIAIVVLVLALIDVVQSVRGNAARGQ